MTRQEAIKHIRAWVLATSDLPPMQVSEALVMALTALRGHTREMVERMRGEWKENKNAVLGSVICSTCGTVYQDYYACYGFCPRCGQPKTDEAVGMLLERRKEAVDDE